MNAERAAQYGYGQHPITHQIVPMAVALEARRKLALADSLPDYDPEENTYQIPFTSTPNKEKGFEKLS